MMQIQELIKSGVLNIGSFLGSLLPIAKVVKALIIRHITSKMNW